MKRNLLSALFVSLLVFSAVLLFNYPASSVKLKITNSQTPNFKFLSAGKKYDKTKNVPFFKNNYDNKINIDSLKQSSWFSTISGKIEVEEYDLVFNRKINCYSSPNRKQNLMFTYFGNGFAVKPLMTKIPLFNPTDRTINKKNKKYKYVDKWKISITLKGCGRANSIVPFEGKNLKAKGRNATVSDSLLNISYENTEKGMEQNFIIKRKPEGRGKLRLLLHIDSKLLFKAVKDGLVFSNGKNKTEMKYNNMKISDNSGREFPGKIIKLSRNNAEIAVNDYGARYPLTIDPLSSTPSWTKAGGNSGDEFGYSVASAGDVNDDGYSDVIVGAPGFSSSTGKAYVFDGSSTGLSTSYSWTATGENSGDQYGNSVATAGDVNGDHYSDIIVGADMFSSGKGKVYVYYGSSSGPPASPSWTQTGENSGDEFGYSVATAGDINGDTYSDIIVSAYNFSSSASVTNNGKAYVYDGSSTGLSSSPSWTQTGANSGDGFGYSISTAGDVNGDGYSDIIVSAPFYPPYYDTNPGRGICYEFNGSSSGLSSTPSWTHTGANSNDYFGHSISAAGDVNGDHYSDIIVGAYDYSSATGIAYEFNGSSGGLSATASWSATGENSGDKFGYSVSTAGDINGDGYSDVIIGAYNFTSAYSNSTGKVYVYNGSSTGLSTAASRTITGDNNSEELGYSVATAGDINGDGYNDIIIGGPGNPNGGVASVYNGSSNLLPVELQTFTAAVSYGQVTLNWETATEVNNYGFEIQRSGISSKKLMNSAAENRNPNEGKWLKIGFVKGAGNSNSPKQYKFVDKILNPGSYSYRLKMIDINGSFKYSKIIKIKMDIPDKFTLDQNYPNPFNPSTKIRYSIPYVGAHRDASVRINVYDILGRDIATLVNEKQQPGIYEVTFDGSNLASGIYFYKITAGNYTDAKKMILMK